MFIFYHFTTSHIHERELTLSSVIAQTALDDPSPSALFANRLMHYCCEEVEAAIGARAGSQPSILPELDRQTEETVHRCVLISFIPDLTRTHIRISNLT